MEEEKLRAAQQAAPPSADQESDLESVNDSMVDDD